MLVTYFVFITDTGQVRLASVLPIRQFVRSFRILHVQCYAVDTRTSAAITDRHGPSTSRCSRKPARVLNPLV